MASKILTRITLVLSILLLVTACGGGGETEEDQRAKIPTTPDRAAFGVL